MFAQAPLAHRLGMWSFRSELADLSLKFLFPAEVRHKHHTHKHPTHKHPTLALPRHSPRAQPLTTLAPRKPTVYGLPPSAFNVPHPPSPPAFAPSLPSSLGPPPQFAQLEAYIEGKMISYQETLSAATLELGERLSNDPRLLDPISGMSLVTVTGRTKNIHSTWKKLQRRDCGVGEVLDLVALRIVIDTGEEVEEMEEASICYHVLGKVHSIWTPLPRTLKDYISSPKPNGYRSLHTTVLVGTQPLEVQIRTKAMHAIAEYGAAAHWAYTEGKEESTGTNKLAPRDAVPGQPSWGAEEEKRAWLQISGSTFSKSITK